MKTEEILSGVIILGLIWWSIVGEKPSPTTRTATAIGTFFHDPAGYRVHRGPTHDVCNHVETQHPNTSSSLDQTVSPGIYDFAVPTSAVFGGENSD